MKDSAKLVLSFCLIALFLLSSLAAIGSAQIKVPSSWCEAHPTSPACEMQSSYLNQGKNVTVSSALPLGVLPGASPLINGSRVSPDSSQLSSQPYVAAVNYQTQGVASHIGIVGATVELTLYNLDPSDLGSNTLSGGLNVHLYDTIYSVDYLFEFYVYYTSGGYANLAWAVYSACAGDGYKCGPAYSCTYIPPVWFCPLASKTLTSGSLTDVGNWGDSIRLLMDWNSQSSYYVFDYQDINQNPSYWTVLDFKPSGSYSTMATGNGMVYGYENIYPRNSPVYDAYYFQTGFSMTNAITDTNWELDAKNIQYGTVGSCCAFAQHAMSMTWNLPGGYYT